MVLLYTKDFPDLAQIEILKAKFTYLHHDKNGVINAKKLSRRLFNAKQGHIMWKTDFPDATIQNSFLRKMVQL